MSMKNASSNENTQNNKRCPIALGYGERIIREYDCGITQAGFRGVAGQKLIITNKRVAVQTNSRMGDQSNTIYNDVSIKAIKGVNVRQGVAVSPSPRPLLILLLIFTIVFTVYSFFQDDMRFLVIALILVIIYQIILLVKSSAKLSSAAMQIEFLTDSSISPALQLGTANVIRKKGIFGKEQQIDIGVVLGVSVQPGVVDNVAYEVGAIIQNAQDGYYDEYM